MKDGATVREEPRAARPMMGRTVVNFINERSGSGRRPEIVRSKRAQELTVLDGIDVSIPEGEFVALMGPSGSGKTTLLNLIAGIDRPTSGKVVVAGTDVAQLSESELASWRSHNVGFIFQFYNLIPVLNATENVELRSAHAPFPEGTPGAGATALVVGSADRAGHYPLAAGRIGMAIARVIRRP
jgi:putative ABC transport system ATP-binding protein